jgi:hypothetical protein
MADCNFNTAISELHKFTHKIVDAIETPDAANAPEVGWPECFECLPLFYSVCSNLPRVYLCLPPPASVFSYMPLSASFSSYLPSIDAIFFSSLLLTRSPLTSSFINLLFSFLSLSSC